MIVYNYGYAASNIYSIYSVAVFYDMFLLFNDYYGGKYMLTTFMRLLLGSMILVRIPYSLDVLDSNYSGLRIYVTNPPRVFPGRLDSIS
jgi:hypothetical protein